MRQRTIAVVVAALAATMLATGGTSALAAEPERKPVAADVKTKQAKRSPAVAAAPADGSGLVPLAPTRVLDTRTGTGAPIGPGATVSVDLSAQVPANAAAVVLNVTGTAPSAGLTYLTVFPNEIDRPAVSNLNLKQWQTRPNAATVISGPSRVINFYNEAGTTHVIADLAGYYLPGSGSKFEAKTPTRVLDTRNGAPVGANGVRSVDLTGIVPTTATAVTFNLTGTQPTASTYVTAYPSGTARPNASNLNLLPGETAPNLVTVAVGADRKVNLFNDSGSVHLLLDVAGYYDATAANWFYPVIPERIFDSRDPDNGELDSSFYYYIGGFDVTHAAALANLTGTGPSQPQYLTTWPGDGGDTLPNTSNLNLMAGETLANNFVVKLGNHPRFGGRGFNLANSDGTVHAIVDLAGIFAPTI